tara:strand:+ start:3067 stop:3897 length:831 start_codon:yes stop_codon:yes gene_type:complete
MVAISALPCSYSKAWSPSDDANLYAWYNQTGLGDVGADQTTWTDQSGNSRDLSESGSVNPVVSATLNGHKGVQFATDTGMSRASFIDIDDQDFVVSMMFQDVGAAVDGLLENSAVAFDLDTPTSGYGLRITNFGDTIFAAFVGKDSGTNTFNNFLGGTITAGFTEFMAQVTSGIVITMSRIGDTVTVNINGIQMDEFTESVTSTGSDTFYLGSYSGVSNESNSTRAYEVAWVVGSSLSSELRTKMEGYMASKYGVFSRLTSGHKYKKATPWGRGTR